MDPRVQKAQQLFWEVSRLRNEGRPQLVVEKLREMAILHEQRADDLLQRHEPDGWTDLYAAITAWGESHSRPDAERVLMKGRQLAESFPDGEHDVREQLAELEDWLDSASKAEVAQRAGGSI